MGPPPNQQAAEVNLTRAMEALSPYLNNPQQTVTRIEALVLVAVGLLFVQLIGSVRRWCGHWSVQGVLWIAYTVSLPLITYTLSQMVSSPIKNALYPLWAAFLFWAAGCCDSIIAFNLEDNKSWKRHLVEIIQYYASLCFIGNLLSPISNREQPIAIAIAVLLILLFFANVMKLIAGWLITNSASSKFVADYMRKQVAAAKGNQSESSDPVTMKGYKYLVCWPLHREDSCGEHIHSLSSFDPITIDEIWEMEIDGSLFNSNKGGLGVKDLCLSFALSHLLKRRYFEMECAEAKRPETRKFILEGLLSEKEADNNYTRAFHIIEAELGFLYDFFFTKYATIFHMEASYLILAALKLISISCCGVVLLRNSPILKTVQPIIEVGTRRIDFIITIIIMASFLAVEVLQLILYVTSDWATVSLACLCMRSRFSKCILPLIRFLQRFKVIKLSGYWQNKMKQSSVIERSMHCTLRISHFAQGFPDLLLNAMARAICYVILGFHSMIFSGKTSVQVPDPVKREIISCLKEYKGDDPLTNGQRALSRHGILQNFSWTLRNQNQTSIMLVWHIATEYCSISLPIEGGEDDRASMLVWHQGCCGFWMNKKDSSGNQQVATTLSRYCAYLMSFVPDLLPGNSTDTQFILERVLWEADAEELLRYKRNAHNENNDDIIITVCESIDNSSNTTIGYDIFTQGLKLGRQLEEIEDEDVRWRVMAEFWAETILYIAPSDNAKLHMDRLAKGGEFLTHVWALLTHAGILQRDKMETPEDIPIINV